MHVCDCVTGPVPAYKSCPGVLEDGTIVSLPLPNTRTATRKVRRQAQRPC